MSAPLRMTKSTSRNLSKEQGGGSSQFAPARLWLHPISCKAREMISKRNRHRLRTKQSTAAARPSPGPLPTGITKGVNIGNIKGRRKYSSIAETWTWTQSIANVSVVKRRAWTCCEVLDHIATAQTKTPSKIPPHPKPNEKLFGTDIGSQTSTNRGAPPDVTQSPDTLQHLSCWYNVISETLLLKIRVASHPVITISLF